MIETGSDRKCVICDERSASASWSCLGDGGAEIAVCRWCATHELPKLMADAVFGAMPPSIINGDMSAPRRYAADALLEIEANFHRAMAHAALGGLPRPVSFHCIKCDEMQIAKDIRVGASVASQSVECRKCGFLHKISWSFKESIKAVDNEFAQAMSSIVASKNNVEL